MSANFLPSIGLRGRFILKPPFDRLINPTTQYECTSITLITSFLDRQIDPFEEFYEPVGAEEAEYAADLQAGAFIVTITSGEGEEFSFPNTAMVTVPSTNGVPYRNVALTISLSAIPDDFDLTAVEEAISDMIYESIGVKNTTYVTQLGGVMILDPSVSERVEAVRAAAVTRPASDRLRVLQLQEELDATRARLAKLEQYLATRP